MYSQDLVKVDAKEAKAIKEKMAKVISDLNLSDEKDKAWSNLYAGSSNELPTGKPFSFVDAYAVVNEDDENLNHIIMVTDTGEECSLSSLTRLCLSGETAKNPLFKKSKKSSPLKDYGVLRDAVSISPKLTQWFNKHKVTRKGQAEALLLSGLKFIATEASVLTYFPNPEERNTINVEDVDDFNKEPADVRIAKCTPRDGYVITLA